jgi:transposase
MEDLERAAYPSDVSDEEWQFVVPYLTLMTEDAPQREHSLREVFNGARWAARAGSSWLSWLKILSITVCVVLADFQPRNDAT